MNIPDSISSSDLEKLAQQAPEGQKDQSELITAAATKYVDKAYEEVKDVMVHKIMVMHIARLMFDWHMHMSSKAIEEGDMPSAAAWMRDAGHLQVLNNIMRNINFGDGDFTQDPNPQDS